MNRHHPLTICSLLQNIVITRLVLCHRHPFCSWTASALSSNPFRAAGKGGWTETVISKPKKSDRRSFRHSSMSEAATNDGIIMGGDVGQEGGGTAAPAPGRAALPRIDGSTVVGKTRWLELRTCDYTDQTGESRKWDYATRTTKQSSDAADAVIIVPLLTRYKKRNSNDQGEEEEQQQQEEQDHDSGLDTILVEQFRPPVGQATLEFPAGLIDKDESPEQAALRELREETGYVGEACRTLPRVSRPVCMSPGLCDETVHVVVVMVDMDNPYNQRDVVKAQPDPGEYIKLHRVSLREGLQTLLDHGESPMAIQGLYLFALGLELGKTLK